MSTFVDITGTHVGRLHQQDFCQALGLGPQLKYERHGTGDHIFSAAAIGNILGRSENPGPARTAFLEITLVNLLLGNTDNHAKNHALIDRGQRPELALQRPLLSEAKALLLY